MGGGGPGQGKKGGLALSALRNAADCEWLSLGSISLPPPLTVVLISALQQLPSETGSHISITIISSSGKGISLLPIEKILVIIQDTSDWRLLLQAQLFMRSELKGSASEFDFLQVSSLLFCSLRTCLDFIQGWLTHGTIKWLKHFKKTRGPSVKFSLMQLNSVSLISMYKVVAPASHPQHLC